MKKIARGDVAKWQNFCIYLDIIASKIIRLAEKDFIDSKKHSL